MPQKGKRNADHNLLLALACGASPENAARQAGVSESTAYRRLADPEFTRQLQAMRSDMVQRTAGALTAAATEAVRTLLDLLKPNVSHAARLGAARSVLEIGVKMREMAELEGRLTALEGRLAADETRTGRR
jgi:hypothetical protein